MLTSFLTHKKGNESKFNNILNQHQQQIIVAFGGMGNVIELCLTNPNATKYVDINSRKFDSLKTILTLNEDDRDSIVITDLNNIDDIKTNCRYDMAIGDTGNNNVDVKTTNVQHNHSDNYNNNVNHLISKYDSNHHMQTVNNTTEYYHSNIVVDCDAPNSSLFKLIDNTNVGLLLYNAILSKKLFVVMMCVWFVVVALYRANFYYSRLQTVSFFACMIGLVSGLLYVISLVMVANITIITLITNTFDFWFKVCNVIVLYTASWIRKYNLARVHIFSSKRALISEVSIQFGYFVIIFVLFVFDAIPLSIKTKRIAIVIFTIITTALIVEFYFAGQDFEWNPFNIEYTQISFKSVVLSSWTNLIIFVAKPVLSDATHYLKTCISSRMSICSTHTVNSGTSVMDGHLR